MKAAFWWWLFNVLSAVVAKLSDEVTLLPPAAPPLPPPLHLGPRAIHAQQALVVQAYQHPQRALAAQGGLFGGQQGGRA